MTYYTLMTYDYDDKLTLKREEKKEEKNKLLRGKMSLALQLRR